jgi:hypothetical protein
LLLCQERLDGTTYDQLIAEHEEFHTHGNLSRFFKRTSMSYPAPADANGGCLYLCEQATEQLIHRIEQAMQNFIPLSVPDGIDHTLQFRSKRFHAGIAFLRKAKCYQQINSLTCKGITEPEKGIRFCRLKPRISDFSAHGRSGLFSSRWDDAFAVLNGIQSVLGSPGEDVGCWLCRRLVTRCCKAGHGHFVRPKRPAIE